MDKQIRRGEEGVKNKMSKIPDWCRIYNFSGRIANWVQPRRCLSQRLEEYKSVEPSRRLGKRI